MGVRTGYVEDQRGQPCSTGEFISHQNPVILDKRRILAVRRQLSSKSDENVSAQQINCNLDRFLVFLTFSLTREALSQVRCHETCKTSDLELYWLF